MINLRMEVFYMPRIGRQKTADTIFHIMTRSIREVEFFKKLFALNKVLRQ
jgi:hypothetical protein